jgi:phytoene dehydrogenase-like protein
MNQLPKFDVAVIGGGLAGLTAATIAGRAGRSVIVFEKSPHAGGRATTQKVEGFYFNQGPHALYRGGEGVRVLKELGIGYEGAQATYGGSWVLRGSEKFPMPGDPETLQSTVLFSTESRVEAIAMLGRLMNQYPTHDWDRAALREWLDTQAVHSDVRLYFEGVFRLSTYCNDPEKQSAGAALRQMIMAHGGVDYLDGGWQSLVDRMRDAALAAGVRIETRSDVKGIRCEEDTASIRLNKDEYYQSDAVIVAANPTSAARIVNEGSVRSLNQWAENATPIYAACLDVALNRLPSPEHQFAIGLDRPLYYSVHTRSARLAPEGGAVIQLAKYLSSSSDEPSNNVRNELEGVLDWLQSGWQSKLVTKRFLPRMMVSNAIVMTAEAGNACRPGPAVPEFPNLFIAGDWVGPHGMLVDASFASAKEAAILAMRFTNSSKSELAEVG